MSMLQKGAIWVDGVQAVPCWLAARLVAGCGHIGNFDICLAQLKAARYLVVKPRLCGWACVLVMRKGPP